MNSHTRTYWEIDNRRVDFRIVPESDINIHYGFAEHLYLEADAPEFWGIVRSRNIQFAYIYCDTEPIYVCFDVISQGHEYSEWYFIYQHNYELFLSYYLGGTSDLVLSTPLQKLDWREVGF